MQETVAQALTAAGTWLTAFEEARQADSQLEVDRRFDGLVGSGHPSHASSSESRRVSLETNRSA